VRYILCPTILYVITSMSAKHAMSQIQIELLAGGHSVVQILKIQLVSWILRGNFYDDCCMTVCSSHCIYIQMCKDSSSRGTFDGLVVRARVPCKWLLIQIVATKFARLCVFFRR